MIDLRGVLQTSSRSTKLAHGGVRYLEGAVKKLDLAQYLLVKEGLKERYRLLQNASHLASSITLVTPLYNLNSNHKCNKHLFHDAKFPTMN